MADDQHQVVSAAQMRGVEVVMAQAGTSDDLGGAFQQLAAAKVQAVIVPANAFLVVARPQILELALASRVPLIFSEREGVDAGGLASYGVNAAENYRRAADYIDKILKGAAPGDLPIRVPDEDRAGGQSRDREGTGADHSAHSARPCRRCDRMSN